MHVPPSLSPPFMDCTSCLRCVCSVAALAFNPNGNQLAIGVSYLYEKGPMPAAPKPQIVVRLVKDEDVRPKALQGVQ